MGSDTCVMSCQWRSWPLMVPLVRAQPYLVMLSLIVRHRRPSPGGRLLRSRFRRRSDSHARGFGALAAGAIAGSEPIKEYARPALRKAIQERRDGLPRPVTGPKEIELPRGTITAIGLNAPELLSISGNREEFLGLIYEYHWRAFAETRQERGPHRGVQIDLAPVKRVTLDAALVLTAEFHRRVLLGNKKAFLNDQDWDPTVREQFQELGLFTLVNVVRPHRPVSLGSPLSFVKFLSGQQLRKGVAKKLIGDLRALCGQEPEREYIYNALVEAIKNVRHHAYLFSNDGDIPAVHSWWAAGAYDAAAGVLQFAVYDQGAGIPATLPRRPFFQSILRLSSRERTDADLIAGALRYGRSRLRRDRVNEGDSGRGNGLWSICEFIPRNSGSSVRIMSGRGEVVYDGGRAPERVNYANPFCGTLIQWTLKLPQSAPREGLG